MLGKRIFSALSALALIAGIKLTTPKNEDYTRVQLVNSDLIMLTVSSLKQANEQMQKCSHDRNCDK